jgi:hypothetical protein
VKIKMSNYARNRGTRVVKKRVSAKEAKKTAAISPSRKTKGAK